MNTSNTPGVVRLLWARHAANRLIAAWVTIGVALLSASCSTVDPKPDYRHAGEMIRDRTGSQNVYDPTTDELVESRVAELLTDGLTADEAVSVALLNNRAFQSLFFDIGVSRADVIQSGLLTNPTLFINALIPSGGGRSKLTYGVAQELAELWQIPKRKKAAEERLESTLLNVTRAAQDVAMRTKIAYYSTLAAQRTEANAKDRERLAKRSANLVEKRYDAGDVAFLDVNRAKANLLSAYTDSMNARHDSLAARASLQRELGLSYWDGDWELSGDFQLDPVWPDDNEEYIMAAADNSLDVLIAERELLAAEHELQSQQRAVIPSVKLGVGAERTVQRAVPSRARQGLASWKPAAAAASAIPNLLGQRLSGPTPLSTAQAINAGSPIIPALANQSVALAKRRQTIRGLLPQFPTQRQHELAKKQQIDFLWGPTLQVTLPVFDQNSARIATARFRVEQKQKLYEELLEALAESIVTRTSKLHTAAEIARFYNDEALPLAESIAEGANLTYEAGEESVLSVIDAQSALANLRKTEVRALLDYYVAKAELEQLLSSRISSEEPFVTQESEENGAS